MCKYDKSDIIRVKEDCMTDMEKNKALLRIVAGKHKGRTILTPKGMDTRPTQGKIRESLFNMLQAEIPGAVILDLFAGSGALGLEALSRDAAYAAFCDHAPQAQVVLRKNIDMLCLQEQTQVLCCHFMQAIRRLADGARRFDVLFVDPPYRFAEMETLLAEVAKSNILAENAVVIYEHPTGHLYAHEGFVKVREKKYGEITLTFLSRISEEM